MSYILQPAFFFIAVGVTTRPFFIENIESLKIVHGLFPFPGSTISAKITWNKPDRAIITARLYDYYPNARLKGNWSNIERWLQAHGIATVLHTVPKDTPRSRKQIGVSCGIVAARVLTSSMLDFDGFTRHEVNEPVHFYYSCFDSRAMHARTPLPPALASVPSGFVLVRVRVRVQFSGRQILSSRLRATSSAASQIHK